MEETCDMKMADSLFTRHTWVCGEKANWKNPLKKYPKHLCTHHKTSLNKKFETRGIKTRCEPINIKGVE